MESRLGSRVFDEETTHRIDNAAQKQKEEVTNKLFEIPHKYEPGHSGLLLQASESDFARGAVQVIKCRLSPDAKLRSFQEFKYHCDFTETHPLMIHFCDRLMWRLCRAP